MASCLTAFVLYRGKDAGRLLTDYSHVWSDFNKSFNSLMRSQFSALKNEVSVVQPWGWAKEPVIRRKLKLYYYRQGGFHLIKDYAS
jgi:hypothetical protein